MVLRGSVLSVTPCFKKISFGIFILDCYPQFLNGELLYIPSSPIGSPWSTMFRGLPLASVY